MKYVLFRGNYVFVSLFSGTEVNTVIRNLTSLAANVWQKVWSRQRKTHTGVGKGDP